MQFGSGVAKYLIENHSDEDIFVGQPIRDILSLNREVSYRKMIHFRALVQGMLLGHKDSEIVSCPRGTNNLLLISDRGDVLLTDQIHPNGICFVI